ncbi:unnamed protein product [Pleuronectes platessa]|uniref:Uncharacterized protein n=1 Tax=Pleuronectes platessa TaxID=8262 RepID=A0A9N7Z2G8_PLEPL|nr:unnamed protein product [Pleuronectes platessa]
MDGAWRVQLRLLTKLNQPCVPACCSPRHPHAKGTCPQRHTAHLVPSESPLSRRDASRSEGRLSVAEHKGSGLSLRHMDPRDRRNPRDRRPPGPRVQSRCLHV